ncbi:hypothetical protein Gotur_023147 [Gossypium turneri]
MASRSKKLWRSDNCRRLSPS